MLAWKDIPYEYEAVHLVKDGGEQARHSCPVTPNPILRSLMTCLYAVTWRDFCSQYKDAYKAVNPMAQVPALQLPSGDVIAESVRNTWFGCHSIVCGYIPRLESGRESRFRWFVLTRLITHCDFFLLDVDCFYSSIDEHHGVLGRNSSAEQHDAEGPGASCTSEYRWFFNSCTSF